MTTATLIPGPPVDHEEWSGDEEEAFFLWVWGPYAPGGPEKEGPQPFVMNFGADFEAGTALVMFSDRELAERFAASPTLTEAKGRAIVKGARAEQFIEMLGVCLEWSWLDSVLVNPTPLHEWLEGNMAGDLVNAAELHADLREAYREFLAD